MQHVVVVVPVDADVDKAQYITEEDGDEGNERLECLALRHLHFQHHDGDNDGDDAITEGFETALVHRGLREVSGSQGLRRPRAVGCVGW